jgi:hypothetical protein
VRRKVVADARAVERRHAPFNGNRGVQNCSMQTVTQPRCKGEHCSGPTVERGVQTQFKEVQINDFRIKVGKSDNCIALYSGEVAIVENTVKMGDEVRVIYRCYTQLNEFFTYP